MKKEILMVLLPLFADWEAAFTSATLNDQIQNKKSAYFVKTVGITKDPIKSIGGLTVLPDYSIADVPDNYSALLLIGGMSWCTKDRKPTEMAQKLLPFVQSAIDKSILVGGICDASTFLGANGWLNDKMHTSNTLADLKRVAGKTYTNESNYIEHQAVQHENVVTANGTAYLEFTKEVLLALKAYPKEDVETHYDFYKSGYYEAIKKHHIAKGI
ncbi:MAG TPA: DJ-1/PfpI family protein [Paenibacillus sp.]|jgi:putative intracellular protease/amidase